MSLNRFLKFLTKLPVVKFTAGPEAHFLTSHWGRIASAHGRKLRQADIPLRKLNRRDFLKHKNPVAAALIVKMGHTKRERPRVKLECLLLFARLELDPNKQRLVGRFVETCLGLDETELREYNQLVEAIP